jgi:hypothetical protein
MIQLSLSILPGAELYRVVRYYLKNPDIRLRRTHYSWVYKTTPLHRGAFKGKICSLLAFARISRAAVPQSAHTHRTSPFGRWSS